MHYQSTTLHYQSTPYRAGRYFGTARYCFGTAKPWSSTGQGYSQALVKPRSRLQPSPGQAQVEAIAKPWSSPGQGKPKAQAKAAQSTGKASTEHRQNLYKALAKPAQSGHRIWASKGGVVPYIYSTNNANSASAPFSVISGKD